MGFTIEIEEKSSKQLGQLLKYMDKETDTKLGTKLAKLIVEASQEMATEAKLRSPVKTGRLRASVHAKVTATESYNYSDTAGGFYDGSLKSPVEAGKSAVIGTNVVYATFQEMRTLFMYGARLRVQPYLKSNLEKLAREIVRGK